VSSTVVARGRITGIAETSSLSLAVAAAAAAAGSREVSSSTKTSSAGAPMIAGFVGGFGIVVAVFEVAV
jgi:hypothetical protein